MRECLTCKKLKAVIDAVDENMGLYPKAVSGFNDERDYKERDGYKNGWNACIIEYGKAFRKAIAEAATISEAEAVFLTHQRFTYVDGQWFIDLNDTWHYASADVEEIPKEAEMEVASLSIQHGSEGLLYWVYKQRGHYPEIPKYAEQVKRIEHLIGTP